MIPSLRHLVEDHFKPKWWQFFRKQKYHVCNKNWSWTIYEVPDKCMSSGEMHRAQTCARIIDNRIEPKCHDGCPVLVASDPAFFQKLDEYLASECYAEERDLDQKCVSAMVGPQGPPGPPGPPGPGLVI